MSGHFGRHTCRARVAKGKGTRARFDQQGIAMAVVAAFKFDDFAAAGKAARQTNGAHGGLGPRTGHSHLFKRRQKRHQALCDFKFSFGRRTKTHAFCSTLLNGLHHLGMGVSQHGRTP